MRIRRRCSDVFVIFSTVVAKVRDGWGSVMGAGGLTDVI